MTVIVVTVTGETYVSQSQIAIHNGRVCYMTVMWRVVAIAGVCTACNFKGGSTGYILRNQPLGGAKISPPAIP